MAKHIKAKILKKDGLIYGFDIKDHGEPYTMLKIEKING